MNTITIDPAWVKDMSAPAAIVLGYLVRRAEQADLDGWFRASSPDCYHTTGLHPTTYVRWRRRFETMGVLEVRSEGDGHANEYRLHVKALYSAGKPSIKALVE